MDTNFLYLKRARVYLKTGVLQFKDSFLPRGYLLFFFIFISFWKSIFFILHEALIKIKHFPKILTNDQLYVV